MTDPEIYMHLEDKRLLKGEIAGLEWEIRKLKSENRKLKRLVKLLWVKRRKTS